MILEDSFKKSEIQKYYFDVETKNLKGRQKTNKVSAEKLTYSDWIQQQYISLIDFSDLKIEEIHDLIINESKLYTQLSGILQTLVEGNYHQDLYPVISRKNFHENLNSKNIEIVTSKENKNRWNKFIASNRTSFDFEKKGVIQYDKYTGEELNRFPTISEAKRVLGVVGHSTHISDCCKNIRETAYGFKWKFLQNNIEESTIF